MRNIATYVVMFIILLSSPVLADDIDVLETNNNTTYTEHNNTILNDSIVKNQVESPNNSSVKEGRDSFSNLVISWVFLFIISIIIYIIIVMENDETEAVEGITKAPEDSEWDYEVK